MRTLILTLAISLITIAGFAQPKSSSDDIYGLNLYETSTGSGHGSDMNLNVNVENNKRSLEFGAKLSNSTCHLSGAEVIYKVFLTPASNYANARHSHSAYLRPYVHYNFMYNKLNKLPLTETSTKKSASTVADNQDSRITTMEHYAGMGLQLVISKNLHFDTSMGAGIYLGSVYNPGSKPETIGIHKDNYGFTLAAKIGIGYTF